MPHQHHHDHHQHEPLARPANLREFALFMAMFTIRGGTVAPSGRTK